MHFVFDIYVKYSCTVNSNSAYSILSCDIVELATALKYYILYIIKENIIYYHSLYSILDFDWLIHLQIIACKYRSAANNWCKYFIEHEHFENAPSASIKNIFLSKCQHGSFCRVIRKRIVHYTRRKGCRKHQKSN